MNKITIRMNWRLIFICLMPLIILISIPSEISLINAQEKDKSHPSLPSLEDAKCLTCHDDISEKENRHEPLSDGSCDSCHVLRKEEDKTLVSLVDKENALCLACHSDIEELLAKEHVHPVLEESCASCHEPHSSDFPKLMKASYDDLCAECHDIQDDEFKNRHGRQPVALTGCGSCHNAHASDYEKLLVGSVQHAPFEQGDCTACHKRARGRKIRLRGEGSELCYACHSDKESEFSKEYIHTPVKRGECSSCHNPHLADKKLLLKAGGNNLCLQCHDSISSLLKQDNIHPPAEESCSDCHSAHASEHAFNLQGSVVDTCLACHDPEDGEFASKHYKQNPENLNCTECHNPHGSENESFLNTYQHPPFLEKGCDSCHEDSQADAQISLVEDGGNELCYACHDDKQLDSEKEGFVQHAAIETEGCVSCHSAHASSRVHLLKDHTSRLCLSCHEERKNERVKGKFIHGAIDSFGCESCHESHFSQNEDLLLEELNQVCLECHLERAIKARTSGEDVLLFGKIKIKASALALVRKIKLSPDLTKDHPQIGHWVSGSYPVDSKKDRKATKTLTFSGEINCLSCHDSHAGSSPPLFVDELVARYQVCLICHEK